MKVLLTMNLPYFPTSGGADKGNRLLAESLVQRGHEVEAVVPATAVPPRRSREEIARLLAEQGAEVVETPEADRYTLRGVRVTAVRRPETLRETLRRRLETGRPDGVLVSSEDPTQSLLETALDVCPERVIYEALTPAFLPFGPLAFFPSETRGALIRRAAAVVTLSHFAGRYMKRWGDVDATVVYWPVYGDGPFPRLGRFDRGAVTMINPCKVKGLEIFLNLARSLPDTPFAVVPSWGTTAEDRQTLEALDNVRFLAHRENFEEILAETRVLLMPSLLPEGFGFTCMEAQLRGIPVLASGAGGLKESKAGTDYLLPVSEVDGFTETLDENLLPVPRVPAQDPTPWREALTTLLGDRELYERQADAAYRAARAFVDDVSAAPLETLLRRVAEAASTRSPAAGTAPGEPTSARARAAGTAGDVADLSPERRALLMLRLRQRAKATGPPEAPSRPAARPRERRTGEPLSSAQERLWFLEQLTPGRATYNVPGGFLLTGPLVPAALADALGESARRHEALRTTFRSVGGRPYQEVHPPTRPRVPVADLRRLAPQDRQDEMRRLAAAEARRPFDLAAGPLFRARRLRGDREHGLLVTLHHIVADGWSLELLMREVGALYSAFAAGRPSELPAPTCQLADHAIEERRRIAGGELARRTESWIRHLAGAPRVLDLPTDRPRPPEMRGRGALRKGRLEGAALRRLEDLAGREKTTPFAVCLAIFGLWLSRQAGSRDLLVGSPVAQRHRRELEGAVGFFVNTQVLRLAPDRRSSFAEWVRWVRREVLEAQEHRDVPFERLVEELQPVRDPSRNPLVQVAFTYQDRPPAPSLDEVEISPLIQPTTTAKMDLTLMLLRDPEGLESAWEYDTDLFDATTVERMEQQLRTLFREALEHPEAPVGELPWLGAGETHQVLHAWGRGLPLSGDLVPVPERIADCARRTPDAVAVADDGEVLTYATLLRRSRGLAAFLTRQGVVPDAPVGLLAAPGPERVVALLGILLAGGALLALDPDHPAERARRIVDDARPAGVLADPDLAARLGDAAPVWSSTRAVGDPASYAPIRPDLAQRAYLVYTSGSTGRPKGVEVPHRALSVRLAWMAAAYGLHPGDRLLHKAAFGFDVAVWEVLLPLTVGAVVVSCPADERADAPALTRRMIRQAVTVAHFVPALLGPVSREPDLSRAAALRRVLSGGEPLPVRVADRFRDRSRAVLCNQYGTSEAVIDATGWDVPAEDRASSGHVPLGRPFAETRVVILDDEGRPVPPGVVGQLHVGGAGLARGYLRDPRRTAERFRPDPWSTDPAGGRLYGTGDRAAFRADGVVRFRGRGDRQLQVRGVRVEPAEVEAALAGHPRVLEAAVAGRADDSEGTLLTAWVVPVPAASPTVHGRPRRTLDNGLAVAELRRSETDYLYREIFELEAYLRHGVRLDPGAVVVDVGANVGLFTLYAAGVSPGARVFAFEPNPEAFEVLEANASLYAPEARLFPVALADREGTAELGVYEGFSHLSGLQVDPDAESSLVHSFRDNLGLDDAGESAEGLTVRTESVPVRTLSSVLAETDLERVDLLKINAEKSELDVLRGIGPQLWPKIRQVVAEVDLEEHLTPLLELLETRGFQSTVEQDPLLAGTAVRYVYAVRSAPDRREDPAPEPGPRVFAGEPILGSDELREFLADRLPAPFVPTRWSFLEALPRTSTGKIDRLRLPDAEAGDGARNRPFVTPRTETETRLAALWEDLLGLDRVGAEDDFFALGGHSLLGTRLIARVRDDFGVEIPLSLLFRTSSLTGVAEAVDIAREVAGPGQPEAPPDPYLEAGERPLSPAQRRLWFLHRLAPDSAAYNLPASVRLSGRLSPEALEQSLAEVIRRHEILRSRFPSTDGRPRQEVDPVRLRLPMVDLSGLSEEARLETRERLADHHARRPFDLGPGPVVRFTLVRTADRDHRLLANFHHLVADAWSLGVLLRELAALVPAGRAGTPSPLPEPTLQYADVAREQWRRLDSGGLDAHVEWWREQLADAPQRLRLPVDAVASKTRSGPRGGRVRRVLSRDSTASLHDVAERHQVTPFMIVLAAFQVLLGRWAGTDDLVVGAPVAGRTRRDTEDLIGFFLGTVPLRTRLGGDPSFAILLRRVREVTLGAFAHQDLPFERLVEEVAPERDLESNPLFDVVLNFVNVPRTALSLPELGISWDAPREPEPKFALMLFAWEDADRLVFEAVYRRDRFSATRMEHLLDQLEHLLAQAMGDPEQPLSALSLVTPRHRRLVPDADDAFVPSAVPTPVTELVFRAARRHPDAPALIHVDGVWSYRRLATTVRHLTFELTEAGATPGEVVTLSGPRSPGWTAGLLAALAAGLVVLPVDPALPEPRRRRMVREAGARRGLRVGGADTGDIVALLEIPTEPSVPLEAGADLPGPGPAAESGAYVVFTSGSTGVPKAVLGLHGGLSHFVVWERDRLGLGPGDRLPQVATPSVDVIFRETFAALVSGAALGIPSPEAARDPAGPAMVAWMRDLGATVLHAVPSLARAWLPAKPGEVLLPDLHDLLLVGEMLTGDLVRRWRRACPGCRVFNLYGATETNLAKAAWQVPEAPPPGPLPVGGPLPASQVLVVAPGSGRLCGVGELGEVVVRTPFLAAGYLNSPGETAQRFVPDEAGPTGARRYRTGDFGRLRPDGALEIVGRQDDQVKIRGVRVEPGEVTACLEEHPAVREAVVQPQAGADGSPRLVAYVVAGELTAGELASFLARRLPTALVPTTYEWLPALPRLAGGKIDRAALPVPEERPATSPAETASPVEEIVAGVWSDLLESPVGRDDNFFDLGGHSLMATRVMARLRRALGVDVGLRRLFEAPRLADFARAVEEALGTAPPKPPRSRTDRPTPLPPSLAQERVWLMDRLAPGTASYNVPLAAELLGDLTPSALADALGEVVRRHEVLRTRLPEQDGRPVQVIDPPERERWPVVDLSAVEEDARHLTLERLAGRHGERSFDLARDRLVRCALLRVGAERHALLWTVHHAVFDGWSRSLLVRETDVLYGAFLGGRPSPLAEPASQYADYAVEQRRRLSGEVLEAELDFWRRRLEPPLPELRLPTDRPRPEVQSFRGARRTFTLPAELTRDVQTLSHRHGTTVFMVLLAAFSTVLLRHTGQEDLVLGTDVAGRTTEETETLLGFFVNQLVLRLDLTGNPSFAELLERVRAVTLEAYAHQEMPFHRLVEEVQPRRDPGRMPLFQVKHGHLNVPPPPTELPGLQLVLLSPERHTAQYDLLLYTGLAQGHVIGTVEYATDLFEAATVDGWIADLHRILDEAVADPDRRILSLPLSGVQAVPGVETEPTEPLLEDFVFD